MVPMPYRKLRIILDLLWFNEAVEKLYFRIESIHTATNMIIPGVFMSSIDAYFTFPIAVSDRKYLKFRWNDKLWRFIGLPMGISCAPRIFAKLITPIYAHLRTLVGTMFPVSRWLFFFFIGFSEQEYLESTMSLTRLFTELGFKVHSEKSSLIPSQRLKFLGFIIDSCEMTIPLPDSKKIMWQTSAYKGFLIHNNLLGLCYIS